MEYEVASTAIFKKWLKSLRDRQAVRAIAMRITRAETGNMGDVSSVGGGVSEMRIFVGKGYRLYFTIRKQKLIILLNGGDKSSRQQDIDHAKKLVAQLLEVR